MQTGCWPCSGDQGEPPILRVQGFQAPVQMVTKIGQGVSRGCRDQGNRCSFGGRAGSDVGLVQGLGPRKARVRVRLEGLQGCFGCDGAPCEENGGIGGSGHLCSLTPSP